MQPVRQPNGDEAGSVLAIDVGGGTQDIFIYQPGQPWENCVQMVLPAETVVVARQVQEATRSGKDIFLYGTVMGGGASSAAVRQHLRSGCRVFATPQAAKTLHNDLARVRQMGVELVEHQPSGTSAIAMGDIRLDRLADILASYGVVMPGKIAIAVQDHGENPGQSNRDFRMAHWQYFMAGGGDVRHLLYGEIPPYLTRMQAVRETVPGAWLADTGVAAIWGALEDPVVAGHQRNGPVAVVNIGNQHTIGVVLRGFSAVALVEHHTGLLNPAKLVQLIKALLAGELAHHQVKEDGGHGCSYAPDYRPPGNDCFVSITGPRRFLAPAEFYRAVPHGNMMLAGSFGLVRAVMGFNGFWRHPAHGNGC